MMSQPKNVLLVGLLKWFPSLAENLKSIPNLLITSNYEEVLGLVKHDRIGRLCIIISGYNYSKSPSNNIEGYEAARELHKIQKDLPILIINGSEKEVSEKTGLLEIISKSTNNEIYIENDGEPVRERFFSGELFQDFYQGKALF